LTQTKALKCFWYIFQGFKNVFQSLYHFLAKTFIHTFFHRNCLDVFRILQYKPQMVYVNTCHHWLSSNTCISSLQCLLWDSELTLNLCVFRLSLPDGKRGKYQKLFLITSFQACYLYIYKTWMEPGMGGLPKSYHVSLILFFYQPYVTPTLLHT
jgi:hypothetical protein